MAMHEVYLKKDKDSEWFNDAPEESGNKFIDIWKNDTAVVDPEPTKISTLVQRIADFDQSRQGSTLKELFVVATFQRSVIDKLLDQGAHGLRIYLSINEETNSFDPIVVAVNDEFRDVISKDDDPKKTLFCGTDSKCPPPARDCLNNLLLFPQSQL